MLTKNEIIAKIEAAPKSKNPFRQRRGDKMRITQGAFAMSDHGACVTEAILGGNVMIKRATTWVGYYHNGVLADEDFI